MFASDVKHVFGLESSAVSIRGILPGDFHSENLDTEQAFPYSDRDRTHVLTYMCSEMSRSDVVLGQKFAFVQLCQTPLARWRSRNQPDNTPARTENWFHKRK
jgi:hypothetical protein